MASSLLQELTGAGTEFLSSKDDAARQRTIAAATALIHELEAPPEVLARIGWEEPSRTAALQTAFELGILGKLEVDTPKGPKELAQGTKADPALVARVLKHLAANGLVKEQSSNSYLATPFSLATSDPTLSAGLIYSFEGMIPTFQALASYLAKIDYQTPVDNGDGQGPVQHGLRTDKSFFEILGSNPRLGQAFNSFMEGYAKARPRWVDFYPWQERLLAEEASGPLLVDVGGGLGHELMAFHDKLTPEQQASLAGKLVLQDVPSVIQQAKEAGHLAPQVSAVAHDFFTAQPPEHRNAKAYFLRLILHDWSDDKCVAILSHLRDAMGKGSKVLVNEAVLKDVGAPKEQTSLDWTMMGMLGSRERTEEMWRELLGRAGLEMSGMWHLGRESVIEAVVRGE